jgi:hypothetical protein
MMNYKKHPLFNISLGVEVKEKRNLELEVWLKQ